MQPGLRMILKGDIPLTASEISVEDMPAEVQLSKSNRCSLRRSHRNLSVHTHRSSLGSHLLRDHPTKVRPALDPSIFMSPLAAEASPIQKRTNILPDDSSDQQGVSELPGISVDRQSRAAEPPLQLPSPQVPEQMSFLKRLKFKRKFMSPRPEKSKKKTAATKKSKAEKASHPDPKQAETRQVDRTQVISNGAQLSTETEPLLEEQRLLPMPQGMSVKFEISTCL